MTRKHFIALARAIAHIKALVDQGVLNTPQNTLKRIAFEIGSVCSTYNEHFDWEKWNVEIFGDTPEAMDS